MASKSPSLAYKHWQRIIRVWPTDLVRPPNVSFQHVMQQRLSKLSSPSPSAAAESVKSNETLVSAPPHSASPPTWNESHELRQIKALDALLENRYANKSPMPASLRRPASNPKYYDDLLQELEEAPNRSWLGGVIKGITGRFRFS